MTPPPRLCPFCYGPAPCIDWSEVHNGVGVQQFEHEYECDAHGVFAFTSGGHPIWRDGDPMFLVMTGQMSPLGHCNASIATADGGRVFCCRKFKHAGRHENAGRRWTGTNPYELCDAAFEEVLAWL